MVMSIRLHRPHRLGTQLQTSWGMHRSTHRLTATAPTLTSVFECSTREPSISIFALLHVHRQVNTTWLTRLRMEAPRCFVHSSSLIFFLRTTWSSVSIVLSTTRLRAPRMLRTLASTIPKAIITPLRTVTLPVMLLTQAYAYRYRLVEPSTAKQHPHLPCSLQQALTARPTSCRLSLLLQCMCSLYPNKEALIDFSLGHPQ